jgi:hypothetical protein
VQRLLADRSAWVLAHRQEEVAARETVGVLQASAA